MFRLCPLCRRLCRGRWRSSGCGRPVRSGPRWGRASGVECAGVPSGCATSRSPSGPCGRSRGLVGSARMAGSGAGWDESRPGVRGRGACFLLHRTASSGCGRRFVRAAAGGRASGVECVGVPSGCAAPRSLSGACGRSRGLVGSARMAGSGAGWDESRPGVRGRGACFLLHRTASSGCGRRFVRAAAGGRASGVECAGVPSGCAASRSLSGPCGRSLAVFRARPGWRAPAPGGVRAARGFGAGAHAPSLRRTTLLARCGGTGSGPGRCPVGSAVLSGRVPTTPPSRSPRPAEAGSRGA